MLKFSGVLLCWMSVCVCLADNAVAVGAVVGADMPWDLERLSKPPAARVWPKVFDSEVTPIMIEGEPYQGRPTWCFAYYGVPESATPVNKVPREILAFADHFARGGKDVVRVGESRREGNRITAAFDANGRNVVRAELLWTADGAEVKWDKRHWEMSVISGFDPASGSVSAEVPGNAFAWIVNLVTDDGLVFSTPYKEMCRKWIGDHGQGTIGYRDPFVEGGIVKK